MSRNARERVDLAVLRADWRRVALVHWPYPPAQVQRLLPTGLVVDTYDGCAWVSLTPFVMAAPRLLSALPVPGLESFTETNLRTYVRGPRGRDGLWFLSVEVANPLAALAARVAVGAPYHLGDVEVDHDADTVGYRGRRHGSGPGYRLQVRPGAPLEPGELDNWLTARWRAYTRHLGLLWENPVEHRPWPLRAAQCLDLAEDLTTAAGLPRPGGPPLLHYADSVPAARFAVPRVVATAGSPDRRRPGR